MDSKSSTQPVNIETLKNIYIFSGFDFSGLNQLREMAVEETVKKGQSLYWEGDPPLWLMILKKGKVKLFKQSKSGKETIIGMIDEGDFFGLLSVLDGRPHSTSAKAMEPSVVLKIGRKEFLALLRKTPDVSFEMILDLSRRLRDARDTIHGMAVERVEKRIVSLLLKLTDRLGQTDGTRIRIPVVLTRQDIADMVGSTVETTIRIISRLSKEGLIETKGKTIFIKDIEKLRNLPDEILDGKGRNYE